MVSFGALSILLTQNNIYILILALPLTAAMPAVGYTHTDHTSTCTYSLTHVYDVIMHTVTYYGFLAFFTEYG